MVSPVIVAVALSVFVYWLFNFAKGKPKNFPPGPIRIPIFGSYLSLLYGNFFKIHVELAKWTKKYNSKIISLFLGPYPIVITGDYNLIHEIYTRIEFDGRPWTFPLALRSGFKRLGVFFVEGSFWLEQRHFTLRFMRDFGFGRRMESLEQVFEQETKSLLNLIESGPKLSTDPKMIKQGRCFRIPDFFAPAFINDYVAILTGQPLSENERERLREVGRGALLFQYKADPIGGLLVIMPWLRFFWPRLSGYKGMRDGNQRLVDFVRDLVKSRKMADVEESEGFIDFYLKELKNREAADNVGTFSEDQLVMAVVDLLLPTASAVEGVLSMLMERLILNPDVQDKMYEEIKSVVGTGRLPNLNDRPDLPYCEACLRESLRIDTLANLGVSHKAVVDTTLGGYDIPKDTVVFANLWQMHNDEKVWGDPQNFRPERFVDSTGKHLVKDMTLPFGLGRRVCAGETFARNTMFLHITGLMQHYKFTVPDGHSMPTLKNRLIGLIQRSSQYWVKAIPRE